MIFDLNTEITDLNTEIIDANNNYLVPIKIFSV